MGLNTAFPNPKDSLGLALWHATMNWQSRQRAALKQHGLTHVQFVLLAHLAALDSEAITQVQLAQRAQVDPMMTSQVIRTLEEAQLVVRTNHPNDARARLVAITAKGVALTNRATPDVEATDQTFFAPIGTEAPALLTALRLIGT